MTTPTAAGWYDDPDNANAQRYWDGHDWTPQRRRTPNSPPHPTSAPSAPAWPPSAPVREQASINEEFPPGYGPRPEETPPTQSRTRLTTATLLIGAVAVLAVALALALGIPALSEHHPTAAPLTAAGPKPSQIINTGGDTKCSDFTSQDEKTQDSEVSKMLTEKSGAEPSNLEISATRQSAAAYCQTLGTPDSKISAAPRS